MSSIANATARPVSTIWKASGWPFAEMMFMPRFWAAFSSVICLMLVVPAVETMVLPLRSTRVLRFAAFFATQRLAVTKWVIVNNTCSWRARVLVVEPHSRASVVFGARAPLEVDGAVRHQRDAVRRGHELVLDVELRHLELVLYGVDDPQAQVHRVADRLLLVVVVRER